MYVGEGPPEWHQSEGLGFPVQFKVRCVFAIWMHFRVFGLKLHSCWTTCRSAEDGGQGTSWPRLGCHRIYSIAVAMGTFMTCCLHCLQDGLCTLILTVYSPISRPHSIPPVYNQKLATGLKVPSAAHAYSLPFCS